MPNNVSSLRGQLQRALSNKIISKREANRIVREISKDGVSDGEVRELVSALKAALDDGLDLSTATRRRNLNRLLARVDQMHSLPINRDVGQSGSQALNYILALRATGSTGPAHSLPRGSFTKQALKIDDAGAVLLGDRSVVLDGALTPESLDALMGLQRPDQLKALDASTRGALADKLLDGVDSHLPVPLEGAGKHQRTVAVTASLSALGQITGELGEAQLDRLLDLYDQIPTPMGQALLHRGLAGAALNDAQKTRFAAMSAPENQSALLDAWDSMNNGQARVGWDRPKGAAAQLALSALAYAKSQTSIDNIYDGMKTYKEVNRDYGTPWDAQELQVLSNNLESYVQKYPQRAFVFGTFSSEAPKEVAKLTNARVQAALLPALEASPASFDGLPLSRPQADYIQSLLPALKDEDAAKNLKRALSEAGRLFATGSSGYGGAPTPSEPLAPAAFALFRRSAEPLLESRDGTADGMIDARALKAGLRGRVSDIGQKLAPRLRELDANPPHFDGVALSPEAAGELKSLLHSHLRSSLSVDNLAQAVHVVAEHEGGRIQGDGLEKLKRIVDGYMDEWPSQQFFDFNKLGRIAGYQIQGKEVPRSTLNGQPVSMATFNDKVALGVAASIDRSGLRQPWIADRWGYRAKESVELLDVIAQQAQSGEGPIGALRTQFPQKKIEVLATGMDGGHQRFVYEVRDGAQRIGRFAQGSDGTVERYRGGFDPVIFRADLREDGALDVQIPSHNRVRKYPLQTTYDVGDSVDWSVRDTSVENKRVEGEKFSTQNKIVEAHILAYSANGSYTIAYKDPASGDEVTTQVQLSKIKKLNNPHFFSLKSSNYSDVSININSDAALKKFLNEAQPIIDKYMPSDGSLATLDPAELAKRQKAMVKELMAYTSARIKYPTDKEHSPDAASKKYWELDQRWRFPLGDLAKIGKGVCRHQCIFEHLLLQRAGIDSRLASGSANTSSGNYRGLHIWTELTLADNARYMSDQTWDDPLIPLWNGAYDRDKRRVEMSDRTARYQSNVVR